MQEVQKYLILTRHIYLGNPLIINEQYFQKLPEDMRKALVDAASVASNSRLQSLKTPESKSLELMKAAGVTIIENPDLEAFAKNAPAVWARFTDGKNITQDLLMQIKNF
jgi:TRAP-type C4-dicarboxylate transport system substrate-binding protein